MIDVTELVRTVFSGLSALVIDDVEDAGEAILRACLSEGLRVRALSRARPTLEDVFLAATRRSWDAVADGQGPEAAP